MKTSLEEGYADFSMNDLVLYSYIKRNTSLLEYPPPF